MDRLHSPSGESRLPGRYPKPAFDLASRAELVRMQNARYPRLVAAVASAMALASCTTIENDSDDPALDEAEQLAVTDSCSAVSLVAPVNGQQGQLTVPMTLTATATCTGAKEFEYWVKRSTVGNWTRLGGGTVFVPGSTQWTAPSPAGAWNVTAVVRTVGTTGYERRTATINVTINDVPPPTNTAPVANPDTTSTLHGVAVLLDPRVNDTDVNSDPLTITNAVNGTSGTVTFTTTGVTYTPGAGFAGQDSFAYTISDGALTATSAVTVTVTNKAPDALDDTDGGHTGAAVSGNALTNDIDADGDVLVVTGSTQPTNGVMTIDALGAYVYTSTVAFLGTDSFTYTVSDGFGGTDTATVTITVSNASPVANPDVASAAQNGTTSGNVLTNDTDPDGDTLSVTASTAATHGTATVAPNGAFTYTPTPGYAGPDSFGYTLSDGMGGLGFGTVTVTVTPVSASCTISIAGAALATYGVPFTLTATASCTTGTAEVRWLRKVGARAAVQVAAYSTTMALNQTLTTFDGYTYTAEVRTVGTLTPTTMSAPLAITVQDSVGSCTSVKLTAPIAGTVISASSIATLTATSVCPGTPEYQYWFKTAATGNFTFIPGFVLGSQTWNVPAQTGLYDLTVVARVVGSHQGYQVRANTVRVNVTGGL